MSIKYPRFLFLLVCLSVTAQGTKEAIQQLLPPTDNCVTECRDLPGGMTNNLILCTTAADHHYVFRYPKKPFNETRFTKILSLAQKAAFLQVSPDIYNWNIDQQQMLMHYIENARWPAYQVNEQPYHATMCLLKKFHDHMRLDVVSDEQQSYTPFNWIVTGGKKLLDNPHIPDHLGLAIARVQLLAEKVAPWLELNATICHGDFHKGNVLLAHSGEGLRPWIIDFDSMGVGDPYFDVVKFSRNLQPHQREELFQCYVGESLLTPEEKEHFDIVDKIFLMVVAVIRFKAALETLELTPQSDVLADALSKKDMEELLNSSDSLPSQSTIPASNPDVKMKQLGAVYALHEFLKKTEIYSIQ